VDPRWYTPNEPWPTHDKPWWADALSDARRAGWQLRTFSGHTWGKVVCDRELPDAHQMLIFSTGRGGENAAKQLQKLIARCQHTRSTSGDSVQAGRLLDGASQLLDAAELLLDAFDMRARAEELLSLADEQLTRLEESEALLESAISLEDQSRASEQRATELTSPARYSPKQPFTGAAIADEAEERIDEASAGTPATTIVDRIHGLRQRIQAIRARL
jgi:hypothetical protein